MKIKRIIVGELRENCYILTKNNKCLIIDPGDEPSKIISTINNEVVGILVTHYHPDHIGALDILRKKYHTTVNSFKNDNFNFKTIKTPGHTSDSISFYFEEENVMFTGDFIFNNAIGRTDLPTGSMNQMILSLKNINKYSDNIVIYPGHGPATTLKSEKSNFSYYIN